MPLAGLAQQGQFLPRGGIFCEGKGGGGDNFFLVSEDRLSVNPDPLPCLLLFIGTMKARLIIMVWIGEYLRLLGGGHQVLSDERLVVDSLA